MLAEILTAGLFDSTAIRASAGLNMLMNMVKIRESEKNRQYKRFIIIDP